MRHETWEAEIDRLVGLPARTHVAPEVDYRAPGRTPLSGTWRGAYLQPFLSLVPVAMELSIDVRGGELVGEGKDRIGAFTLAGTVEPASGETRLRKEYVGAHAVLYVGLLHDGILRGVWSFPHSDRRGLFLLGHESLVPARRGSVLDQIPSVVALWLVAFRIPTTLHHRSLIRDFLDQHSALRAWLA